MIDQQTTFTVHQTFVKAKLFEQIEPELSSDGEFQKQEELTLDSDQQA